ncbi:MAG TPA: 1-deoxy-D-xylulose-5-phosphate reductoisomerase [Bacteroidetes bacterium]|nr:1-deoxy-D-xylulose-5-phosphate reductoisomerase [Bacteroidota bacterium]
MKKTIAILGSTGSIGTQTLDVIAHNPDKFEVKMLTAGGNVELLIEQARKNLPDVAVIRDKKLFQRLKEGLAGTGIKTFAGQEDISALTGAMEVDLVVGAIVGYAGLKPVISALETGKDVALANKETLVVAGSLIKEIIAKKGSKIIPVDSEHSAIFQCLVGEERESIEKITLTASGGPFRDLTLEQLKKVTPKDALNHPNWEMGTKVTVDSASLMNKGLEVIEAKWLFGLEPEQIDVVIHPQSVIHSFVHFRDGSVKAQLGLPDMRTPILYALGYPKRLDSDLERIDFAEIGEFTFAKPDHTRFRNLSLAYSALREGGNKPCVLNAANEIAVNAFCDGKIGFLEMTDVVEQALGNIPYIAHPNLEALENSDKEARERALTRVNSISKQR